MFCPHKNSYLQLVCAIDPRIINKAVDQAMFRSSDPRDYLPNAIQRLESMQPSLYASHVDITRARMGYGRDGLKILTRELHSEDFLVQVQALHSILDQVQISENAIFLIDLHLVYRLKDLLSHRSPIVREKVCLILTHLANHYQGKKAIVSRPVIIEKLIRLILRDKREIRFAAAGTLNTLTKDRFSVEKIIKTKRIIENLLKMLLNEHSGIVSLHLKTLQNLFEWDPELPLKNNSFQILLSLIQDKNSDIISNAMDCLAQLLKHPIGRELSDKNDLTLILLPYLYSEHLEVIKSAVSLMQVTTLTTASKWRAREFCDELTERLVELSCNSNKPILQLNCMQVLINLCDSPDIRNHMKMHWKQNILDIYIKSHKEWDGTSGTSGYGFESGHNYRTVYQDGVECIKNDYGDSGLTVNLHTYIEKLNDLKLKLIDAINWKSYKN